MTTHSHCGDRSKNPSDVKMEDHVVMWVDNGRNWDASKLGCQDNYTSIHFSLIRFIQEL